MLGHTHLLTVMVNIKGVATIVSHAPVLNARTVRNFISYYTFICELILVSIHIICKCQPH